MILVGAKLWQIDQSLLYMKKYISITAYVTGIIGACGVKAGGSSWENETGFVMLTLCETH